MAVKPIPDGYHTVTPYLIVEGVAQVIDFLKTVFDAGEKERMVRPDGTIMHAEIRIGDSYIMLAEPMGGFYPMPSMLYLYVADVDSAYQRAITAGAESVTAPANQMSGDRNAGVRDQAGNIWWIATRVEDVPPQELKRRAEEVMKRRQ